MIQDKSKETQLHEFQIRQIINDEMANRPLAYDDNKKLQDDMTRAFKQLATLDVAISKLEQILVDTLESMKDRQTAWEEKADSILIDQDTLGVLEHRVRDLEEGIS